ncbi:Hypothetical predicted protein [Mytilus galloprovincialis]|uniref:C1q domain-containing protein n=1 Tax=Mytilus galloprovincialis TaxID=29158 RepID=A0A8B6C1N0_MYTGA|nr:Hypothetical predicted protein [Mytilus galloprovincialis]
MSTSHFQYLLLDEVEQKLIKCENQSVHKQAYESLEKQVVDLERKYADLERKYNQLQSVNNDFNLIKNQLMSVQNKTREISNEVSIMKHLENIKQSQEIQTFCHDRSSILDGPLTNTIMKFGDVKLSVGITNLSAYKTTGKFTCEHEGLYILSASVMSYTDNARYFIYLNGNTISETYISQNRNNEVYTGAATVTLEINPNDKVWLYADGSWYLSGGLLSRLTIIKIK